MSVVIDSADVLSEAIGVSATGDWLVVDQDRISAFADATEDRQWIHLDTERAATGPFGGTIAHGYLTLSLLPRLTQGLIEVQRTAMVINYGLDKVRFLQPVASGSRIRATTELVSVEATGRGYRAGLRTTVEIEGEARPALVAETIALFVPQPEPSNEA